MGKPQKTLKDAEGMQKGLLVMKYNLQISLISVILIN